MIFLFLFYSQNFHIVRDWFGFYFYFYMEILSYIDIDKSNFFFVAPCILFFSGIDFFFSFPNVFLILYVYLCVVRLSVNFVEDWTNFNRSVYRTHNNVNDVFFLLLVHAREFHFMIGDNFNEFIFFKFDTLNISAYLHKLYRFQLSSWHNVSVEQTMWYL